MKPLMLITFCLALLYCQSVKSQSGFHYFNNPVDISHFSTGSWVDVDVSSYIPVEATGVILHLGNDGTEGAKFAVRKNGSTDTKQDFSILSAGTNIFAFCGVDENRLFESYIQSAGCKIYLTGYSDDKLVYFNNVKDISIRTTNTWVPINVSSQGVPEDATGVILQVLGANENDFVGLRSIGSEDDRTGSGSVVYQYGNYTYLFCGINEERIFEAKVENAEIKLNLAGYTKNPVRFLNNAIKINPSNAGTWSDVNLSSYIPLSATGIIFEINNTYNGARIGGFRTNGSTDTLSSHFKIRNESFTQGACGVDASKIIEAYFSSGELGLYLIGYSQEYDGTPPSSVIEVRDGQSVDIDQAYKTNVLYANWNHAVDSESGIGRYLYAIGTTQGGTDIQSWTDCRLDTFVVVEGLNLTINTTYFFTVKAENSQGLQSTVINSDGLQIISDTTPPEIVSIVRDGQDETTDQQSTFSPTDLFANWNFSSDPESGILKYRYSVGTTQGGIDLAEWTDNGLNTSANVILGSNLNNGTVYYFNVKAVNTQGMESAITSSNGILVINDVTPPEDISAVRDGIGADSKTAYLTSELRANWSPSVDLESGIKKYYYAIGTTLGGTDIINWTNNQNDTSVVKTGLTLTPGTTYYFSAVAENVSGLKSAASNSNGITILQLKTNERVANSGSSADVQAAINEIHALGKGTVFIPEGNFEMNSSITLYSNISLIGAGIGKTIIHLAESASVNSLAGGDSLIRISNITFFGYGIINFRSVVDFRIDHCRFETTRNASYLLNLNNRAGSPSTRGVVDHCDFYDTFTSTYAIHCGPKLWPANERSIDVLGTKEAVFVEDCYFHMVGNHPIAGFNGANYVCRYSSSYRCGNFDGHGPVFEYLLGNTVQARGTRCYEFYNNYFFEPTESGFDERWSALGLRGGGGVVYNNTFVNQRYAVRLTMETGSVVPTGGTYPGIDQIHDMWIWGNNLVDMSELILLNANNAETLIQEDRDYFLRSPSQELDGFTYTPYIYPHPLVSVSYQSDISICQGESYLAGGSQQTTSGTYRDTLIAENGADSIIVTNLTVNLCADIPDNLTLADTIFESGETGCFNALDTIIVGGGDISVEFLSGSTVNLIAEQSIIFLPGFRAFDGCTMNASITTDGTFCDGASSSSVVQKPVLKSLDEGSIIEKQIIVPDEKSIKVYPNPNNGQFTIELVNFENGASICIYNTLGIRIHQSFSRIKENCKINMPGLKRGIYVVKVTGEKEQVTKKITVF